MCSYTYQKKKKEASAIKLGIQIKLLKKSSVQNKLFNIKILAIKFYHVLQTKSTP